MTKYKVTINKNTVIRMYQCISNNIVHISWYVHYYYWYTDTFTLMYQTKNVAILILSIKWEREKVTKWKKGKKVPVNYFFVCNPQEQSQTFTKPIFRSVL